MLTVSNVALARGGRILFDDLEFSAGLGDRVGIVGPNGCGKTSLLRAITGDLEPEKGSIERPADWRLVVTRQESPGGSQRALEYVMQGDEELARLQSKIADAEARGAGSELARHHEALASRDGYAAEGRAGSLMHGLGFSAADQDRPLDEFSGGWRGRLALARALFQHSDVLLLDEPTNHLDLPTIDWLVEWIDRYPGLVLCISHDRDFLDRVANRILWIDRPAPRYYLGNLSEAERRRAEILAHQAREDAKVRKQAAHLQRFVDRFRAKASKASQAQSRLKMLERLETSAPLAEYAGYHFEFPEPQRVSTPLLALRHADLGYGDAPVLRDVSLSLLPGARVGLLGRNGAGKSTLVKALAGMLDCAERVPGEHLAVGYFAQHQLEQLRLDQSPLTHMRRLDPDIPDQRLRDFLGGFGFHGDHAIEPLEPRSGGERARLALAMLAWRRPNLLLLDEPTNHLDLQMRDALSLALQEFSGAVVLISHDRAFLTSLCDEFHEVAGGRVVRSEGPGSGYGAGDDSRESSSNGPDLRKQRRQEAARERERLRPLIREVRTLEERHQSTETELVSLQKELADPALYSEDHRAEEVSRLSRRAGELEAELEKLEDAWLTAQEALDAARRNEDE